MDRVGLRRLVAGVTVCALLYLGATIVPTETSQIASQFMCTLLLNIFFVVAARWALLYAPSSIFGTFSGMQMSLMALLQLISSPAVSVVSNAFFPGKSNSQTHLRFVFVFAPWEGVGDKQGEEVEEGEGGVGDKQGEEGVGISSRAAHGKALSSPTSGNICSPSSTFTTPSFAQF